MGGRITVNVHTHGHCFDGLASASLFTILLERIHPGDKLDVAYKSCGYGPKFRKVPKGWLSAQINAILDFRYTESPRLTYYFDHHATAFDSDKERDDAVRRAASERGRALHFDPTCSSCAKLIDAVARSTYGIDLGQAELVAWADQIDSARFASPDVAFFAREPALRLADIAERHADTPFVQRYAPRLGRESLSELAASSEIRELAAPLDEAKQRYLAAVTEKGQRRGEVVVIDLAENCPTPAGKFATYVAFPDCRYSVVLLRTRDQLKLGVGHNPWSGLPRLHDVAAICREEGGGGHPMVGAVNFAHDDIDRARTALQRVARTLADPPR